jgi:hypothetical protein
MWVTTFGWSLAAVGFSFSLLPGLRSLQYLVMDSKMGRLSSWGAPECAVDVCPYCDRRISGSTLLHDPHASGMAGSVS